MDRSTIKLDQFLKLVGAASTGGEAKILIQDGQVTVNGSVETRRGRKLVAGDTVELADQVYTVPPGEAPDTNAPVGSTSLESAESATIQE